MTYNVFTTYIWRMYMEGYIIGDEEIPENIKKLGKTLLDFFHCECGNWDGIGFELLDNGACPACKKTEEIPIRQRELWMRWGIR
jgi:hypothetical protein